MSFVTFEINNIYNTKCPFQCQFYILYMYMNIKNKTLIYM